MKERRQSPPEEENQLATVWPVAQQKRLHELVLKEVPKGATMVHTAAWKGTEELVDEDLIFYIHSPSL